MEERTCKLERNAPIGVFDSGMGGLSVLAELRRQLPGERLVYVADSEAVPYGDRTESWIEARSRALMQQLCAQRVKAVVIACNTVTGVAVDALRARFAVPIVAIEPAVKLAVQTSASRRIAVLATTRTLGSPNFARLVRDHAREHQVVPVACSGLADRVEVGDLDGALTHSLLRTHLGPWLDHGIDTWVLACTHYAFLTPAIRQLVGPEATILDPASAVARQARRRLESADLLSVQSDGGQPRFLSTREPEQVAQVMSLLWSRATRELSGTHEVDAAKVPCERIWLPALDATL